MDSAHCKMPDFADISRQKEKEHQTPGQRKDHPTPHPCGHNVVLGGGEEGFPFVPPGTQARGRGVASVAGRQRRPSEAGRPEALPRWKVALLLWLSWNNTYENMAAGTPEPGNETGELETAMDEMEAFRRQAIELSRELLA